MVERLSVFDVETTECYGFLTREGESEGIGGRLLSHISRPGRITWREWDEFVAELDGWSNGYMIVLSDELAQGTRYPPHRRES